MSSTKSAAETVLPCSQAGNVIDIGAPSLLGIEICAASGAPRWHWSRHCRVF